MPTGYTAMIEDGNTNAQEYVKACARAFGMFIHQRDDSLEAPLKYPEKDTYYAKALDKARKDLVAAESWNAAERTAKYLAYVSQIADSNSKSVERAARINSNYETVLAKLDKWNPDDEINQNVKKFCIDQINLCYPEKIYLIEPEASEKKWYEDHVESLRDSVNYYVKNVEKDNARHHERSVAIDNLFADIDTIPA